jgi:hypothetical protein
MDPTTLILIVLVGAGAFYAGYQVGRFKALSERGPVHEPDRSEPLPGPGTNRRQADAGGTWDDASPSQGRTPPPRRSSKPPPAAAGLMNKGD